VALANDALAALETIRIQLAAYVCMGRAMRALK
jgi:hypothetical protein